VAAPGATFAVSDVILFQYYFGLLSLHQGYAVDPAGELPPPDSLCFYFLFVGPKLIKIFMACPQIRIPIGPTLICHNVRQKWPKFYRLKYVLRMHPFTFIFKWRTRTSEGGNPLPRPIYHSPWRFVLNVFTGSAPEKSCPPV